MYANLRVTVETADGKRHRLSAWKVRTAKTGRIYVHTDEDGPDEKYANPGPVRQFPAGSRLYVAADF